MFQVHPERVYAPNFSCYWVSVEPKQNTHLPSRWHVPSIEYQDAFVNPPPLPHDTIRVRTIDAFGNPLGGAWVCQMWSEGDSCFNHYVEKHTGKQGIVEFEMDSEIGLFNPYPNSAKTEGAYAVYLYETEYATPIVWGLGIPDWGKDKIPEPHAHYTITFQLTN